VGHRDEAVVPAVPDEDRDGDGRQVEAGRLDEGQVVVDPALGARREGAGALGRQCSASPESSASPSTALTSVRMRSASSAVATCAICSACGPSSARSACRPCGARAELDPVVAAHADEGVQALGVEERDAGQRRRGDDAVGQERRAGEGVRTAAGDPPGGEAHTARMQQRLRAAGARALRRLRRPQPPLREQVGLTRLETRVPPVRRRPRQADRPLVHGAVPGRAPRGRPREVLEIAERTYTDWYGDGQVTHSEVLHRTGVPEATIVGDLTRPEDLPHEAFDCFICTQTFQVIEDLDAAIRGARSVLKPGGVLLATGAAMSQTSPEDLRDWGDWHRFTAQGLRRSFRAVFEEVEVGAHGNVLTCAAFLYGFAAEELTPAELAHRDPHYDLLLTVRAVRGS
jgi:SAM-dependent methyltransferase